MSKRTARQEKRGAARKPFSKTDEVPELRETAAAHKKLLATKEAQVKAEVMEAVSKIIFDDDKDLDVQASAVKSYLLSLEAHSVELGAMIAGRIKHSTKSTGIIDSYASANL